MSSRVIGVSKYLKFWPTYFFLMVITLPLNHHVVSTLDHTYQFIWFVEYSEYKSHPTKSSSQTGSQCATYTLANTVYQKSSGTIKTTISNEIILFPSYSRRLIFCLKESEADFGYDLEFSITTLTVSMVSNKNKIKRLNRY